MKTVIWNRDDSAIKGGGLGIKGEKITMSDELANSYLKQGDVLEVNKSNKKLNEEESK